MDEEDLIRELPTRKDKDLVQRKISQFGKLPNSIIDPSFTDSMIDLISQSKNLYAVIVSDGQTKTGNNDKYLRMLWEVGSNRIGLLLKWSIHAKGGTYRKWYGNLDTVIDWSNEARAFYKEDRVARITPEYLWYKEGITWSLISGQNNSFRLLPEGLTFNCAAPTVFVDDRKTEYYVLALLNSCIAQELLKKFNATINLTIDDIGSIPYIVDDKKQDEIYRIVDNCIDISKEDWDSFETSWDFRKHPLLAVIPRNRVLFDDISSIYLSECYMCWESECNDRFNQLKANEEELNRIFIAIYGLQDELEPEVKSKNVTVRKADLQREIKSLISYAVGCVFGRYSLDMPGLAYAGGAWDASKYKTFIPAVDAILPICDDEYFEDDIVGRFVKFIEAAYGKDSLEENLKFIADALGGKGTPRQVIRSYFLNDFYADHLKIYQKRPIYWLFDSGKKNGFKCLIYMHRYQPDTIARIRTDYVHEQQERYRSQIQMIEDAMQTASTSERVKLNKQLTKFKDQALELQKYEEKIHHLADQAIAIDLDDGVKVNYAKFEDVLAKIK